MGKGSEEAKNSGGSAPPRSSTASASPKEEKRTLGVISSLSQRTNRYIPVSPPHIRKRKNFTDGPQQQSATSYELHRKPRSFVNLSTSHHSTTPSIVMRSNRSQTVDEHALNPSSPRDRVDLSGRLDTDLITTKPYHSATPKLRRRAGSHASEIEGTVASLDIAVSIHRPQQHVQTTPLMTRKNKSPLGSYNPSQVIKQLNTKLAQAERENGSARQVEMIGNQIVEERRELMKIFKQLKAQEQKHHELLKEDDQIQEIISKTKVKELQHHIPRQSLERIESEIFLATISGPNLNENVRSYKKYMSAISTSTYPVLKGAGRAGDPICDFYYSRVFEQGTIFALSDGCNWGKESQQAAQRAATCFVKYLQDRLYRLTDTRKVTREILSAFAAAHEAIMEGKDQSEFFRIGTATLVGGALLPLLQQQGDATSPQKPLAAASLFSGKTADVEKSQPPPPLLMQTPRVGVSDAFSSPSKATSPASKSALSPSEMFDGPKRPQRKRSKRKSSPRRHSQRALGGSPLKKSTSASDPHEDGTDSRRNSAMDTATDSMPDIGTEPPSGSYLLETVIEEESSFVSPVSPVSPRIKQEGSPTRKRKGHKPSKSVSERVHKSSKSHNRHRSITHYGMYNISMDQGRKEEYSGEEEEIDQKQDWSFIFGSVGDCKVFLYNPTSASATDITSPNRTQSLNAADCGGRLGPCDKEGRPDLRNLFVVSATVRHGDIILVMSDGIHDNLDPELLGKFPSDLDHTIDEGVPWKELSVRDAARIKTVFQENTLAELINQTDQSSEAICNTLVEYSRRVTLPSRSFMEQNPSKELPDDYTLYPGKMDHTSCVCITVSHRNNASDMKLVRDAFVRKDTLSITHSHMSS